MRAKFFILFACAALFLSAVSTARAAEEAGYGPPISVPKHSAANASPAPARTRVDQTPAAAMLKSRGCLECHKGIDTHTMHTSPNVVLGCTDCHGGDASVMAEGSATRGPAAQAARDRARAMIPGAAR